MSSSAAAASLAPTHRVHGTADPMERAAPAPAAPVEDDLWGDEPDWVRELDALTGADGGGGDADEPDESEEDLAPAQHVLLLIDCGPAMVEPLPVAAAAAAAAAATDAVPQKAGGATGPATTTTRSALDWGLAAFAELYRLVIKTAVVHKAGKRNGVGAFLYDTRPRPPLSWGPGQLPVGGRAESDGIGGGMVDDDEEEEEEEDDDDYLGRGDQTVHELVPLDVVSAPMLRRVLGTLPHPATGRRDLDVRAEYGRPEDDPAAAAADPAYESHFHLPLFRALQEAKQALDGAACVRHKPTRVKGRVVLPPDARQVWVLTNQATDPACGSDAIRGKLGERLAELRQAGVPVYVWQLPRVAAATMTTTTTGDRGDGRFLLNPVFAELGMIQPPESEQDPLDPGLFARVAFRLAFKLRPSFSVPLLLPDWKMNPDYPGIQVDFYKIVKRARKPLALQFHHRTGREVKRVTRFSSEQELIPVGESRPGKGFRQSLPRHRIKFFAKLGSDDLIEMQPEDTATIKRACNANPDVASLIISGFKPRHQIHFFDSIEDSYFMYPQEGKVEGSSKAFAQLFDGMQRKGVLAVGELLTRVSATSRCVAFWPVVNQSKEMANLPPQLGMVMVYLPFEDEVRKVPKEKDLAYRMSVRSDDVMPLVLSDIGSTPGHAQDVSSSPNELLHAAIDLINHQSLNDRMLGIHFPNAYLSEFYMLLENLAIGDRVEWHGTNEYDTIMTEQHKEDILKAVGEQVETLQRLLPLVVADHAPTRKRKTVATAGADDSGLDWNELYDKNLIGKQKNDNLKKYCAEHGLAKTGRKEDLVNRIVENITQHRGRTTIKNESDS